jgi:succinate dehydrogenase / fumarate reductase, cytochrome b subunit
MEHQLTATAAPQTGKPLIWARLGSFLSIVPLGVWTVNHLWDNLAAFQGGAQWERAVTGHTHPLALAVTMLVVLGPLLIHAIWGVQRMFSFRPNNASYPTYANFRYLIQRIAGAGVLFFLGAHIWLAMARPRLLNGAPEAFADIAREMRFHGPTLVVYLLGILGVAYHLANGISGFSWTFGLVSGRRALKRLDAIGLGVFLVLLAMGWGAVYALWRAGGQFGP